MVLFKSLFTSATISSLLLQNASSFAISNRGSNTRRIDTPTFKSSDLTRSMFSLKSQPLGSEKERSIDSINNNNKVTDNKLFANAKKYILPVAVALPVLGYMQMAHASPLTSITAAAADSGFVQSFLLIFISEIGDKTFFIAGLLAAKYGKLTSFIGSISALAVMTIISTLIGQIFHAVPSSLAQGVPFDDYIAIAAFSYFGLKTLYDSSQLAANDNTGLEEEKEEAEKSIAENFKKNRSGLFALLFQIFSLVFAAEIGDRSFISTIALSAAQNPVAVATGAIVAHGTATGVAVLGGELLSKYLSEKVIGYIGGGLFLIFAITTAIGLF